MDEIWNLYRSFLLVIFLSRVPYDLCLIPIYSKETIFNVS